MLIHVEVREPLDRLEKRPVRLRIVRVPVLVVARDPPVVDEAGEHELLRVIFWLIDIQCVVVTTDQHGFLCKQTDDDQYGKNNRRDPETPSHQTSCAFAGGSR